ncbi:diaminopimelate epimerase [Catenisphaera adipataccumulans]|uniref:Diaminopimelate epimerase n=1 Tax=Catenisphaera adipataccumulans TaxID=700500 RepID=A0A7W8CY23_9FIRM|nr:diaminopimelate epimerase [Catenisphaera adipataccumulans]MBB5182060.1 diaminopimelate epimerase [Catenisphaera adipataccumulans]
MHFTKMHGLGNDYLYVYGFPVDPEERSIKLSERHFGAGSDGMIYIMPSLKADFEMRIFNADGSEAMMCGNGIRCVGKYVYDKGYTKKKELDIDTKSGIKHLSLHTNAQNKVDLVTVDMGEREILDPALEAEGHTGTYVSMGNPHFVLFTEDAEAAPVDTLGPVLECAPQFPDRANIEFVQVVDEHTLRMRVWERGSGITMACGTGACASVAAAAAHHLVPMNERIEVKLDGGSLYISVSDSGAVEMTGPAAVVYEGETVE